MLSLSNIIVRVAGLAYKVWLASVISPVALGLYQLAMSVYSVFITPVATGLPSATNRLSAKYASVDDKGVFASALKLALVPTVVSFFLLFLGKDIFASLFLHEKSAGILIVALIPALTLGMISSIPASYLHSQGKTAYPAVFEIFEQCGKILFSILLIKLCTFKSDVHEALVPTLAVSLGGILSFIMMFSKTGFPSLKNSIYQKELLENAVPPTLARLVTSLLHLGTTTVLPLGLVAYGMSKEGALSVYGVLTSMAYPVVFAPMTVLSAICVVTLPQISSHLNDRGYIKKKFRQTFLYSLLITLVFSVLLLFFAKKLATEVFAQPIAAGFMIMLIPSIIFLGLNHSVRMVLSGLGKQKALMTTAIIDGAIGLILTCILVRFFGIYGFIFGNVLQDTLAFIINLCLYFKYINK